MIIQAEVASSFILAGERVRYSREMDAIYRGRLDDHEHEPYLGVVLDGVRADDLALVSIA